MHYAWRARHDCHTVRTLYTLCTSPVQVRCRTWPCASAWFGYGDPARRISSRLMTPTHFSRHFRVKYCPVKKCVPVWKYTCSHQSHSLSCGWIFDRSSNRYRCCLKGVIKWPRAGYICKGKLGAHRRPSSWSLHVAPGQQKLQRSRLWKRRLGSLSF